MNGSRITAAGAAFGRRLVANLKRLYRRSPRSAESEALIPGLRESGLFDGVWYLRRYPDVRAAGIDPLLHYMAHGYSEGRRTGLIFDGPWYAEYYRDVKASNFNPLEHYWRHGAAEGRAPSVLFDPQWYLEQNPDVAQGGILPAQHYALHGRREGRAARSIFGGPPGTIFARHEEPALQGPAARTPRIAVAADVLCGDLSPEICSYLCSIPHRFTSLFTVPDETVKAQLIANIERYGLDCDVKIVVSQDQGFGLFLVAFREDILKHDLLLHIRADKSSRLGGDQANLRRHLLNGLLGSELVVTAVLQKFENDPAAGVIYPTTFDEYPTWGHNWLSFGAQRDDLFRRLDISQYQHRGLIDFPVGGMFWARPKALAKLLEYPWETHRLEAGPTRLDDAAAQALERSICQISAAAGYDNIEFDPHFGKFRRNFGGKNLHKYADAHKSARAAIDAAKVVSFDFYDTLVCRRATTPDDVHSYIGWRLEQQGVVGAEDGYYAIRKHAEANAREIATKGDVDIHDIYARFAACCSWSPDEIALAKRLELDIEERILIPRQDVIDLLIYAHEKRKRVILVSDSYMPTDFFRRVLETMGLSHRIAELYISSDRGLRKDRGGLWALLKKVEAPRGRFVHFGDNEQSDLNLSAAAGLASEHVLHTTLLADLRGLHPASDWTRRPVAWRDGVILGPAIAKLASNAYLKEQSFMPLRLADEHEAGYVLFGPLLFGFLTWLIGQARSKDLSKLWFFSREGYFLLQLYDLIKELTADLDLGLPDAAYLYTSRCVAMGARQAIQFDPEAVVRGPPFRGAIKELLRARLGFQLPEDYGPGQTQVRTPEDGDVVMQVMMQFEAQIRQFAEGQRRDLLAYLDSVGFSGGRSGVVDIGYSGTIQSCLQDVLGQPLEGFYMATWPGIARALSKGGAATGYYMDGQEAAQSVLGGDLFLIVEAVLTAPHGQVIGFKTEPGGIQPRFKNETRSNFAYLQRIIDGAKDYVRDLLGAYGPEAALVIYSPRACETPLQRLIEKNLRAPIGFWPELQVEDEYCGNSNLFIGSMYGYS
jgi:FMN phosphatase YigB (HAD superfamily)